MQRLLLVLVAFLAFNTTACFAQSGAATSKAATQKTKHRIVYDMMVADTARQATLMRQINSLKQTWPDAAIEVVVYSKALEMLVTDKTNQATAIKNLQAKGVVFAACENSMRVRQVTKEQLLPAITTVPMALTELILKQEQGWSYLKF